MFLTLCMYIYPRVCILVYAWPVTITEKDANGQNICEGTATDWHSPRVGSYSQMNLRVKNLTTRAVRKQELITLNKLQIKIMSHESTKQITRTEVNRRPGRRCEMVHAQYKCIPVIWVMILGETRGQDSFR